MPRGGLSILSDVRRPTLAIVCKQCGRRLRSILKLIAHPGWRRWPLPQVGGAVRHLNRLRRQPAAATTGHGRRDNRGRRRRHCRGAAARGESSLDDSA